MRGGVLEAALLCAALGIALAYAPARARSGCLALLAASSALAFTLGLHSVLGNSMLSDIVLGDIVLLAGWLSVIACAGSVHLPKGLPAAAAALLSVDAGLCAGALVALEGRAFDLPLALCGAFALVPAAFAVRKQRSIAAKVASSWLIAIAVLASALPYLPVTPGYLPDHLE